MQYYTSMQLNAGIVLLGLYLVLIFLIGVLYNPDGMNIGLMLLPVSLAVITCLFIYSMNLNNLIQKKKNLENSKHNFNLKTCPKGYKKVVNHKETLCKSDNPNNLPFYLKGDDTVCAGEKKQTNGCFNEIKLKSDKCDKIKNFFSNEDILNSWHEYQSECNS